MSKLVSSTIYLIMMVFIGFVFAIVIGLYMDVISEVVDEHFHISSINYEGTLVATESLINTGYWIPYAFAASGIIFVVVTVLHKLLYTREEEYEEY